MADHRARFLVLFYLRLVYIALENTKYNSRNSILSPCYKLVGAGKERRKATIPVIIARVSLGERLPREPRYRQHLALFLFLPRRDTPISREDRRLEEGVPPVMRRRSLAGPLRSCPDHSVRMRGGAARPLTIRIPREIASTLQPGVRSPLPAGALLPVLPCRKHSASSRLPPFARS